MLNDQAYTKTVAKLFAESFFELRRNEPFAWLVPLPFLQLLLCRPL